MNPWHRYACLGPAILLASSFPCRANILLVNADGTGEYPNIRAAVDAAVDGDEIHLVAGTYTGEDNANISFTGLRR